MAKVMGKIKVTHVSYRDQDRTDEFRGYSDFSIANSCFVFQWNDSQVVVPLDRVKECVSTLEEDNGV
jgi:hypothetical protein